MNAPALLPHWAPRAGALLVAVVLATVALLRLSGWQPTVEPGAAVQERMLRFADTRDGAVAVLDAGTGETLALMQGEQGFLRGVLRGLARDRRRHAIGRDAPYRLSLHEDARLMITDPATGARIDLASFGPDNAAVFLQWLPLAERRGIRTPP